MEESDSTEVAVQDQTMVITRCCNCASAQQEEGILCDVFSQKCSAAWQGARAERLTVGIMLPDPQEADDWLNFMLSQKNLWPTFYNPGYAQRGNLSASIQQRAEKAAGLSSVDGCQVTLGGAP